MEWDHITPPPTAFYFNVHFMGPVALQDMSFIEVTGLTMEMETLEIDEGGGYKRRIPGPMKHGNLVCKRPMKTLEMSVLSAWAADTMEWNLGRDVITCDILVSLLSFDGTPECAWALTDAYPVKWDVAGFDSKKNDIALETIEFAYDTVIRVK